MSYSLKLLACHSTGSPVLWISRSFRLIALFSVVLEVHEFHSWLVAENSAYSSGPLKQTELRCLEVLCSLNHSAHVSYDDPAIGELSGIVSRMEEGISIAKWCTLYIKIRAFFTIKPGTVSILCFAKVDFVLAGLTPSLQKKLTYPGITARIPFFCARNNSSIFDFDANPHMREQ